MKTVKKRIKRTASIVENVLIYLLLGEKMVNSMHTLLGDTSINFKKLAAIKKMMNCYVFYKQGHSSEYANIKTGIPQGTIKGWYMVFKKAEVLLKMLKD